MIFPLNDIFEVEQFNSLHPDYHIPRKKKNATFFLGLFPELLLMVKFLSILG